MTPTYPAVAQRLLIRCRGFRRGEVGLDVLAAELVIAADQICIPDERTLRDALLRAEGELDVVRFTVDDGEVHRIAVPIVETVEDRLVSYLAGRGAGRGDGDMAPR